MSDMIEDYLKEILGQTPEIEIKRSDIANQFDVVPSQINYVIKTRFTIQNGYLVRSKRGGGGYIRIEQINELDNVDLIEMLLSSIGTSLTEREASNIINTLYNADLITQREGNLMMVAVSRQTLSVDNRQAEDILRANVLSAMLNRLRFEN
ncbi:MAG TPA: CtsR family transcriptional regulator [Candidatus Limosilactobacillus merdipullorum]|uniref:Transcriptional regulator CtsR n=1 Tax=Candidatus Limosilactobacillus merdipullorum TaxID=2838653 RepID=A0A9D1QQ22_9LACO|nr:CtsR family transcriptional regulator [Candidatus Limosilactobacillus merdipullorum]